MAAGRRTRPPILALLAGSLLLNVLFGWKTWQRSVVISVPDGDSIQLADGRRVRLLGIDAPERNACLADEARERLSSLAKGKHVRLKQVVTDNYGRQLANVIIEDFPTWIAYLTHRTDPLLNRAMVREGLARFVYVTSPYYERIKDVQTQAKDAKRGIWSETCRSGPPKDESCAIKGNVKEGNKTYHLPGCANYEQTIVDEAFGDFWFCNEKDAQTAGFVKATGCPK